ncbi:hypothetical protein FA13DRAFT_1632013, partial [Coprinellus micaceus]
MKRLQVLHPNHRNIPLLIGCALPRRDRPDVFKRYCRIMLLFFKPWVKLTDLKESFETWQDAFADFETTCPMVVKTIMDNMQLLHECRDSKDD